MRGKKMILLEIVGAILAAMLGAHVGNSLHHNRVQAAGPSLTSALTRDGFGNAIQQATGLSSLVDGSNITKAVTTAALTSNVVTITTSTNHTYAVGMRVTVTLLTGPTLFADMNGTYVITVVGSGTTFSYALTHANISSGAATGSTVANYLSTIPTGTTQITLVFPAGSFALVIIPTAAADATFSYTTSGGIGGTFPLYQNTANVITGIEGDTVYIQRTTTTPLAFQFACGR